MTQPLPGLAAPDDPADALRAPRLAAHPASVAACPASGASCHNCGGSGSVYLEVLTAGPYRWPPERTPITRYDGAWWKRELSAYPCPVCNARAGADRIALLWDGSGLLPVEREWQLDYIDGLAEKDVALAAARATLAGTPHPTGWAIFYGGYGVGKTGILKSLTAAFIRAGVAAHYCRAADVLSLFRASYDDDSDGENERQIVRRYAGYPFLAIDEINRASTTKWALERLFGLFDDRYNRQGTVATAMATNTPPGEFGAEWGYFESRTRDGLRLAVGGAELRGE